MEIFSVSLALSEGNPPVTGGFPSQRPVTRSFDFVFDLRLNKESNQDADDFRRHDVIIIWQPKPLQYPKYREISWSLVSYYEWYYMDDMTKRSRKSIGSSQNISDFEVNIVYVGVNH